MAGESPSLYLTAHSYIKLPVTFSYPLWSTALQQTSVSNYHISSGGKASSGNCVQGHTRDSQVSRPRDALQIRSDREQGQGKKLPTSSMLPEPGESCQTARGRLQPPTSRASRQIRKHSHNTCIHTNTHTGMPGDDFSILEHESSGFLWTAQPHSLCCGLGL